MKKIIFACMICAFHIYTFAFESGHFLAFNIGAGGSFSDPHLTREVLDDLNPLATSMKGTMSTILLGGSVDYSMAFFEDTAPFLQKTGAFDGIGFSVVLGAEQGSAGQKINARVSEDGAEFDIFMIVDYNPVLSAGASLDFYFFDSMRVKIGGGTRIIADMNPEYLLYTTLDDDTAATLGLHQQVGTIIVTDEMISKFNAFMGYVKADVHYYVPISETVVFSIGGYGRYDWYRPEYITMPANMYQMVIDNGGNPDKAQPDYWLNSIDFGVSVGFSIAIGDNNPYR